MKRAIPFQYLPCTLLTGLGLFIGCGLSNETSVDDAAIVADAVVLNDMTDLKDPSEVSREAGEPDVEAGTFVACPKEMEFQSPWNFIPSPHDGGIGFPQSSDAASKGPSASAPEPCPDYREGAHLYRGGGWLRPTGGGPIIDFDDGSQVTWNIHTSFAPPLIRQSPKERIWIHHDLKFCKDNPYQMSAKRNEVVEIRESEGGKVLFLSTDGPDMPDLSDAYVEQIFGVFVTTKMACSYLVVNTCDHYRTERLGHVVMTEPEQFITYGLETRLQAPTGVFDVFWTSTRWTYLEPQKCWDFPNPDSGNRFIATKTSQ